MMRDGSTSSGVCPACDSDRIEMVGDTVWCAECGELVADMVDGRQCFAGRWDGQRLSAGEVRALLMEGKIQREDILHMRHLPGVLEPLHRRPPRRCSYPGCNEGHYALGYCLTHYSRSRYGIPMDLPPQTGHGRLRP